MNAFRVTTFFSAMLLMLMWNFVHCSAPVAHAAPHPDSTLGNEGESAIVALFRTQNPGIQLSPPMANLLERAVGPVVANRTSFLRLKLVSRPNGDQLLILNSALRARQQQQDIILGNYQILLKAQGGRPYVTNPPVVSVLPENRFESRLELPLDLRKNENWELIQGAIRSMFRADFLLHPHLALPPEFGLAIPKTLSPPQKQAIQALFSLEAQERAPDEEGKLLALGLVMPVGMGKTFTAAKYVAALERQHGRPARVIYAVQNTMILSDAERALRLDLGLEPSQVARFYGVGEKHLDPDFRLLVTSRTSFRDHLDTIQSALKQRPAGPVVVIFDEGHHVGTYEGEFQSIIYGKDQGEERTPGLYDVLGPEDRILFLSATPWHKDTPLIQRLLRGRIHGIFLTDEEQALLRQGERLEELSRRQLFRGMQQGYLSPLYGFEENEYIGEMSAVDILNDAEKVENEETLLRQLNVHQGVVNHLKRRIYANRIPTVGDRGVIFVPTISHANLYAGLLNRAFGVEMFKPLHSALTPAQREETYDWFRDPERFPYYDARGKTFHKYILAVNVMDEGVDIPELNLLINLRKVREFRRIEQNLGRGGRTAPYKPDLRLIDYSGDFVRLMTDPIATSALVVDRRTDDERAENPKAERPRVVYKVTDEVVDPEQFRTEAVEFLKRMEKLTARPAPAPLKSASSILLTPILREVAAQAVHRIQGGELYLGIPAQDDKRFRSHPLLTSPWPAEIWLQARQALSGSPSREERVALFLLLALNRSQGAWDAEFLEKFLEGFEGDQGAPVPDVETTLMMNALRNLKRWTPAIWNRFGKFSAGELDRLSQKSSVGNSFYYDFMSPKAVVSERLAQEPALSPGLAELRSFMERYAKSTGPDAYLQFLADLPPDWVLNQFHERSYWDRLLAGIRRGDLSAARRSFYRHFRTLPNEVARRSVPFFFDVGSERALEALPSTLHSETISLFGKPLIEKEIRRILSLDSVVGDESDPVLSFQWQILKALKKLTKGKNAPELSAGIQVAVREFVAKRSQGRLRRIKVADLLEMERAILGAATPDCEAAFL